MREKQGNSKRKEFLVRPHCYCGDSKTPEFDLVDAPMACISCPSELGSLPRELSNGAESAAA